MTGWNLPPGVNDGNIPGNRPEDALAESASDDALNLYAKFLEIFGGPHSWEAIDLRIVIAYLGDFMDELAAIEEDYRRVSERL